MHTWEKKQNLLVYYIVQILPGAAGTAILLHRTTIKYLISDRAKGNSKRQVRKHKMLIILFLKSIHMIIL